MAAIPTCPRCIGGQIVRTYPDEPPACFQCGYEPLTDDERAKGQRFAATQPVGRRRQAKLPTRESSERTYEVQRRHQDRRRDL